MLAIIRALQEWRHFIEGAEHQCEIWTDHKNLEYFMTAKQLNRRQAGWLLYLSRFDFALHHKPGKSMGKPDALSCRSDHGTGAVLYSPPRIPVNSTGFLWIPVDQSLSVHRNPPQSTGIHLSPQESLSVHRNPPQSTGFPLSPQDSLSVHRNPPQSTGFNVSPQDSTSVQWIPPQSTGVPLSPQDSNSVHRIHLKMESCCLQMKTLVFVRVAEIRLMVC